jgi:hypothetical protein
MKNLPSKPQGATYLVFSLDHDRGKAVAEFAKRFNKEPEKVTTDCNHLWLGPIPEMNVEEE